MCHTSNFSQSIPFDILVRSGKLTLACGYIFIVGSAYFESNTLLIDSHKKGSDFVH
jgi:hypothetical protein